MVVKSACYTLLVSFIHLFILRYTRQLKGEGIAFKLWRYGASYIIGVSLYLIFWYYFATWAGIISRANGEKWVMICSMIAIMITTVILLLQDFVILRRIKIQTDMENAQLLLKASEAENLLLRQQIQPHFLFNALNTLKALIKTDPAKGEYYLIQLADFLRVAVSHNRHFTASVEDELTICRNYLNMQKIRFGESLHWELKIEDDEILKGSLPSFSLQPLLENAIKHNAFTRDLPLQIKISQQGETIEVSNTINQKQYGDVSTKSGLGNLAERYRLLTGDDLNIHNDGKIFSVRIRIIPK